MSLRILAMAAALVICAVSSAEASCAIDWKAGLRDEGVITAEDLASLRDIPGHDSIGRWSMSVNPAGTHVAIQVAQAFPAENRRCLVWFAVRLDRPQVPPMAVGYGGSEDIHVRWEGGKEPVRIGGAVLPSVPVWSADGKWFAYLRRDSGHVDIWRTSLEGNQERLTRAPGSVERFFIDDSRNQILFEAREPDEAHDEEGRSGYLFDDRFWPQYSSRPMTLSNRVHRSVWVRELDTGAERLATREEKERFATWEIRGLPGGGVMRSVTRTGTQVAWLERINDKSLTADRVVKAIVGPSGTASTCSAPACTGPLTAVWWSADRKRVLFLQREGANREEVSIHSWIPGDSKVRAVLRTRDNILGCDASPRGSVCLEEATLQPRRLTLINEETGARSTLFDPNPGFTRRFTGQVVRVQWSSTSGPAFGDLVLPGGHKQGDRHPLIVIPYRSRGFLRGSVSDEYPILPWADQGFAVLQIDVANDWMRQRTQTQLETDERKSATISVWADAKKLGFESTDAGIRAVEELGVVQPGRIGIAGFSYGGDITNYGIIHAPGRFAAVITAGFAWDPGMYFFSQGPYYQRHVVSYGMPSPVSPEAVEQWRWLSPALNAKGIHAPWLMNARDSEYLTALQTYGTLRDLGRPVELYVFPGEHHILVQPAHRLAAYRRNIDWMRFWLQGQEDPDPSKAAQYERWRQMRAKASKDRDPGGGS